MKKIKYFSAVMAMAVCSALALTSCEKESFDVNSQSQGSSSSSTQEIVIPQNDAKLVVAVSVIDISTFKDVTNATISMNGEAFASPKTWSAPSIQQMQLNFTAEAVGYYTTEKIITTPSINKGEFVYIPVTIYLRAQETSNPYVDVESEEVKGDGQQDSEQKPENLADILQQTQGPSEPVEVSLNMLVPTGTKLTEPKKFEEAVNCITWEEPFVDYTAMFGAPDSKGLIETTIKNVQDKLLAWASQSAWSYEKATVNVSIPAKTIDINVKINTYYKTYTADVIVDIDVEGEEKEFGVKQALFGEVASNSVEIVATTQTGEVPIYHGHGHGHGGNGSGGAAGE